MTNKNNVVEILRINMNKYDLSPSDSIKTVFQALKEELDIAKSLYFVTPKAQIWNDECIEIIPDKRYPFRVLRPRSNGRYKIIEYLYKRGVGNEGCHHPYLVPYRMFTGGAVVEIPKLRRQ